MSYQDIISNCTDTNWHELSKRENLSECMIEKYQNNVNWDLISIHQKLSEPFIEKFRDKVDWDYISSSQKLSEPFIEKYHDKLDWRYISYYQNLSESFIEKHADKVDWDMIKRFQKLSEDFCKKYNIESNILNIVHNCGDDNQPIIIFKDEPDIINIGYFKGSKQDAIEAIKEKYHLDKDVMNDYIAKVEECFNWNIS